MFPRRGLTLRLCPNPTTRPGSRPSSTTRLWPTRCSSTCPLRNPEPRCQTTRALTGSTCFSASTRQEYRLTKYCLTNNQSRASKKSHWLLILDVWTSCRFQSSGFSVKVRVQEHVKDYRPFNSPQNT